MLQVRCPKCRKVQNYEPRAGKITSKTKRCVYCGHSFKVHSDLANSRITRDFKP